MDVKTINGYKIKDEVARQDLTTVKRKMNKKVYFFNNINSMKTDSDLTAGDIVKTKGYYEENDGGSAEYIIVDDAELIEDGALIHALENGLKAQLIKNKYFKPEQIGAYGDGIHDDSEKLNYYFSKLNDLTHIHLSGNYGLKAPVKLPTGYGVTIDGGTFTALEDFDNTEHDYLFYIDNNIVDQPDGFGVPSTGLRLSNMTFMCDWKTSGIEIPYSLNLTIDKCVFLFYKEYGINVYNNNSHDLIISNCQFRGNGYGDKKVENVTNTGIRLMAPDSIIKGCIFAYGQCGLYVQGGANLISDCHFYAHQNHGCNIRISSFENIITHCYFDGGMVWISSAWKNYINNSLFVLGNGTEYMVKVSTNTPSEQQAHFWIENCIINDERTDQSTTINFITYDNNITNFKGTKILNIKKIQPPTNDKVIMNNPFNDIQINEITPSFLGMKKYVASVNTSTNVIGNFTEIDGSSQYYKAVCSGNTVESEFIGADNFYQFLVIPFYVTEKSRVIGEILASSQTAVYFYDENHDFISQGKATLEPGLYYAALYKSVSRCVLNVAQKL